MIGELKANRSARLSALVGCCVNVVPRFGEASTGRTLRDLAEAVDRADREDRLFDRMPVRALLRNLRPDIGAKPFFAATLRVAAQRPDLRRVDHDGVGIRHRWPVCRCRHVQR